MKLLVRSLIILLFFIPLQVFGATYYVDPDCPSLSPGNGSTGSCDGDANDPFNSMDDVNAVIANGDDVYFLSGTTLQLTANNQYTRRLKLNGINGTSGDRMIIGCYWMDGISENIDCTGKTKPILQGNACFQDGTDVPTQSAYEGIIHKNDAALNIVSGYITIQDLDFRYAASVAMIYMEGPDPTQAGVDHVSECTAPGTPFACCTGDKQGVTCAQGLEIIIQRNNFYWSDGSWTSINRFHDSTQINNVGKWNCGRWAQRTKGTCFSGTCYAAGLMTGAARDDGTSYNNRFAYNDVSYCKECIAVEYLEGRDSIAEYNVVHDAYGAQMMNACGARGITYRYNIFYELNDASQEWDTVDAPDQDTGRALLFSNEDQIAKCMFDPANPFRAYGNLVAGAYDSYAFECEYCNVTANSCYDEIRGVYFNNTSIEPDRWSINVAGISGGGYTGNMIAKNNINYLVNGAGNYLSDCTDPPGWTFFTNHYTTDPGGDGSDSGQCDYNAVIGTGLDMQKMSGWHDLTTPPSWEDFKIFINSIAKDTGTYLTKVAVADSGSGTSLYVEDAVYFHGDEYILVDDTVAQIVGADYTNNILILASGISRQDGDNIWMSPLNWSSQTSNQSGYIGVGQDIGAIEYFADTAISYSLPANGSEEDPDGVITLSWTRNPLANAPSQTSADIYVCTNGSSAVNCIASVVYSSLDDVSNLLSYNISAYTLNPNIDYYWMVRTNNAGYDGEWPSTLRYFGTSGETPPGGSIGLLITGDNNTVLWNLINGQNEESTGIKVASGATGNKIYNTTVVNCGLSGIDVDDNVTIKNTVMYNNAGPDMDVATDKTVTCDSNSFQDSGISGSGTYSCTEDFGLPIPFRDITINYSLGAGVEARNGGVSLYSGIEYDLIGRQVTDGSGTPLLGGAIDKGSFEFNKNAMVRFRKSFQYIY